MNNNGGLCNAYMFSILISSLSTCFVFVNDGIVVIDTKVRSLWYGFSYTNQLLSTSSQVREYVELDET